jgi:hypothetical protein
VKRDPHLGFGEGRGGSALAKVACHQSQTVI